ncbi:MAG: hypothetical protein IJF32_05800, partial [Oscillospiraceae bacterium]|nr:hypothetical protein [Oscillospiraceae bacterium]
MGRVANVRKKYGKENNVSRVERIKEKYAEVQRVNPAPKTAEEREADINRREANRSVQYFMRPEVRAGAIKRAEAVGDTDKVRELSNAKDIENWAKAQTQSDSVRKEAQRRYDEEFLRAKARGDMSPAVAADKAANTYLDLYRNAAQKTRNNVYNYRQDENKRELEEVSSSADFGAGREKGRVISNNLGGSFPKNNYEKIIAFVNNGAYRDSISAMAINNHGDSEMAQKIGFLTDKEKDVIRYYASKGETDKVEEYYKLLERTLNKRVQEAKNKEMYEGAYKNPVMGSARNVLSSFATPGAYIANAVNAVGNVFRDQYVPTDTNTRAFSGAHMAKQTSEGVTDKAYDAAGGGSRGELASLLAGTGLSMANFISKAPLGPTGAMVAMGADTAGQTTLDVLERGGTPGQALFLSTAAGTIEALTEKM